MKFFSRPKVMQRGRTLYLPGPLTQAKQRHVIGATKELLRVCKQPFVESNEVTTAGFSLWYAGYESEFKRLMEKNMDFFDREKITMIITNDPHEAHTLRERYGIKALHLVEFLAENLEKIAKQPPLKANYHHPCFLTKMGVMQKVPIRILRRAGIILPNSQPPPRCCGSVGDDFDRNDPLTATKIAQRRTKDFSEQVVITCCPFCAMMLKKQKVKVKDISEVLVE
jgi:Fe-S oxidoreductase